MVKYDIYRILNLKTRKWYIGKTKKGIHKRWLVHKSHARHHKRYKENGKSYLYRAMRKYGIENFEIKKIDEAKNEKHSCFLESFYIKYYNSTDPSYGYNLIINGYKDGLDYISPTSSSKKRTIMHRIKMEINNGVRWNYHRKKWEISCRYGNTNITKCFKNKKEAIKIKDFLSLYYFGEDAYLINSDNKEKYDKINIEKFIEEITHPTKNKNKYTGVTKDRLGFYIARANKKNKRIYIGTYTSEKEAAIVRDKVAYFLWGEKEKFNFPNLVNKKYIEEGKKIFEKYSDPKKPTFRRKQKSSKYNNVSIRSTNTWEMSFGHNKKRVREIYSSEMDAAKAYDYYCRKLRMNLNKLNFPNEIIEEKPVENIVRAFKKSKLEFNL